VLEELYQDLILEYAGDTSRVGQLCDATAKVQLKNPLCGDHITLSTEVIGEHVSSVRYECEGCLISKAAASLMAANVEGKSLSQARRVSENFTKLLQTELDQVSTEELGDLAILAGVRKFPARTRCALLAFEAFKKAIDEHHPSENHSA
jgi:nitrogen fixation NifU-like protein